MEQHLGWAGSSAPWVRQHREAGTRDMPKGMSGHGAPRLTGCKLSLELIVEHCGACRGAREGMCRAGRGLKVPKMVISLIQGFVSLGPVMHDRVNEKEGDPAAQETPAPAP